MSPSLPHAFGPYVLRRTLGAGSGGAVYLARPGPRLEGWPSQLVIKLLHENAVQDPSYVARFEHEAEVAVRVEHRNVVRVLDAGVIDGRYYITMDHVNGRNLASIRNELADRQTIMPIPIAANILRQILDGLVALHSITDDRGVSIGFVHRDLSPRNIMVADDGRVRLIDLGLGKSSLQEWKTQVGTTLGSAGYMPPEQAAGDTVDQAADIYAVGSVAFELFAGQRMIPLDDVMKMLHATIAYVHRPLPSLRPEVSQTIDAMVRRATQHRPRDRFAGVDAFREALMSGGVEVARDNEVAAYLKTMFGPVEPVPLGLDDSNTAFAEPPMSHTVFARRAGLPPEAALMYQPTRAAPSPMTSRDRSRFDSASAAPAVPEQRRRLGMAAAVGGVVLALIIAIGVTTFRPSSPEVRVVVGQPPINATPVVSVTPTARAHPPPTVRPNAPPSPTPPPARKAKPPSKPTPTPAAPVVEPPPTEPTSSGTAERRSRLKRLVDKAQTIRLRDDVSETLRREASALVARSTWIDNVIGEKIADGQLDDMAAAISDLERRAQQSTLPSAD